MKINKHNEKAHIGNGKLVGPTFIGMVSEIVTGNEYMLTTQDKLLRPGGGSAYAGFATDATYDLVNNHMYSVRGPYIIRHNLGEGNSVACSISGATNLVIVEHYTQSDEGGGDTNWEGLILVNEVGSEGCQVYLVSFDQLEELGFSDTDVPINMAPHLINFVGVELQKTAEVIGDNPGPGWDLNHFLSLADTTTYVMPFFISQIKVPNYPENIGNYEDNVMTPTWDPLNGLGAIPADRNKIWFQITNLDRSYNYPLHHCVIFQVDFNYFGIQTLPTEGWNVINMTPAFFPMYYFACNKSVISTGPGGNRAWENAQNDPPYFQFESSAEGENYNLDPTEWGLSPNAPAFYTFGANGTAHGDFDSGWYPFDNLSQDTVWPFNIIQKCKIGAWAQDPVVDNMFGDPHIYVDLATYVVDFDKRPLVCIMHNTNMFPAAAHPWMENTSGTHAARQDLTLLLQDRNTLYNFNNVISDWTDDGYGYDDDYGYEQSVTPYTSIDQVLSQDLDTIEQNHTEAVLGDQGMQRKLDCLWYHGAPQAAYIKNSIHIYAQYEEAPYENQPQIQFIRPHIVISPVLGQDDTGQDQNVENYWVKYNSIGIYSRIMGESLISTTTAYGTYTQGGTQWANAVHYYLNDPHTIQKNVNNALKINLMHIRPGPGVDRLSLPIKPSITGSNAYQPGDGFCVHSIHDWETLMTYQGQSADAGWEVCNIPQLIYLKNEESLDLHSGMWMKTRATFPIGSPALENEDNNIVITDELVLEEDGDANWPYNSFTMHHPSHYNYNPPILGNSPEQGIVNNYSSFTFLPATGTEDEIFINRIYPSNLAGVLETLETTEFSNVTSANQRMADSIVMSTLHEISFRETYSKISTKTSALGWADRYDLEISNIADESYTPVPDPAYVTTLADIDSEPIAVATGVATFIAPYSISYRFSLLYDGHQESPLSLDESAEYGLADDAEGWRVHFTWMADNLPDRATHVNIYRKYTPSSGLGADENYKLVKSQLLRPITRWGMNSDGLYTKTYIDKNESGVSYEALNGINENIASTTINYSFATASDSYLFVGGCHVPLTGDDYTNYIFRSMPGNFSQFNWPVDYVILKDTPTALTTFNGRVFAFSLKDTYKLNQATLQVEDIFEGAGCANDESVMVTEYGMCFADNNGIYFHDGVTPAVISSTIASSSAHSVEARHDSGAWQDSEKTSIAVSFDAKRKSFLIFFDATVAGLTKHRCWAYNIPRKRWDLLSTRGSVTSTFINDEGSCLYRTVDGNLFSFLSSSATDKKWSWHSKELTMGSATQTKKLKKVYVNSDNPITQGGEGEGTCTILTNGSNNVEPVTEIFEDGDVVRERFKPKENKDFNKVSIRLDNIDSATEVSALGVIYKRKPVK